MVRSCLLSRQKARPDPVDVLSTRARDTPVAGDKARELFGPDVIWPRALVLPDSVVQHALDLL